MDILKPKKLVQFLTWHSFVLRGMKCPLPQHSEKLTDLRLTWGSGRKNLPAYPAFRKEVAEGES